MRRTRMLWSVIWWKRCLEQEVLEKARWFWKESGGSESSHLTGGIGWRRLKHSQLCASWLCHIMPKAGNDKLQGLMNLLVLRTLESRGPLHGHGLSEHIRMRFRMSYFRWRRGLTLSRDCIAWSRGWLGSLRNGKSPIRAEKRRCIRLRRAAGNGACR